MKHCGVALAENLSLERGRFSARELGEVELALCSFWVGQLPRRARQDGLDKRKHNTF